MRRRAAYKVPLRTVGNVVKENLYSLSGGQFPTLIIRGEVTPRPDRAFAISIAFQWFFTPYLVVSELNNLFL
jgi:hypothetical protein